MTLYRIVGLKDGQKQCEQIWHGSLSEAQIMTRRYARHEDYDEVQVVNADGHVCLHHKERQHTH